MGDSYYRGILIEATTTSFKKPEKNAKPAHKGNLLTGEGARHVNVIARNPADFNEDIVRKEAGRRLAAAQKAPDFKADSKTGKQPKNPIA